MEIKGTKVILRDMIQNDIDDRIRWETQETEWLKWDAPWEQDDFDSEDYRARMLKKIANQDPDAFRFGFQICINDETKKHIGWVNAYYIDQYYQYSKTKSELAIGISIPDVASLRKGYATEAWRLYINYALHQGTEKIYTQTWSGNERVIGLMKKVGFQECHREKNFRIISGILYDSITFQLNTQLFEVNNYCSM